MSARSLLARALASVAVVGVAIAVPVTGAGAATNETSTPGIGITADLGSGPIVTIGGTPRSGATAVAPVDGHAHATVGTPTVPRAAAPVVGTAGPALAPVAPVLAVGTAPRLVDADVTLHACIAAALLGGRSPVGCGLPVGSPTPSLADALARVGVCARAAVLAAAPVTPCGATDPAGSTGDAAVPPSLVGLDTDAQVCLAATVLGLADPSRCSTAVDGTGTNGAGSGTPTTGDSSGTTAEGDSDVCLGLAVLTTTDGTACRDVLGAGSGNGSNSTAGAGTTGNDIEPLSLSTGSDGSGDGGGALAFTGTNSLLLTLAGLGSVVGGFLLRRATRVRLLP